MIHAFQAAYVVGVVDVVGAGDAGRTCKYIT